ncbi:Phosphatidylglycerol/phosphatidylinositol transfer protein [Geranomyces variabilis]|uniref:Phosphatidylglycerol/phosphatidylinositol transfer protein n=1 Tax=Geranomyces variabilis TaxID=109894 RepID=A0AAD5TEI7_9FUNG|nr:Phosphatidylglycerol/phosphatidylinositol transfer protein [Geranomyces variabilis]
MKATSIFLAIFAAGSALGAPASSIASRDVQIANCGSSSDAFHLTSLDFSPNPPVSGQPITVHLVGSLDKAIAVGASADVTVSLGFFPVINKHIDICDTLAKANISCPVAVGPVDIIETMTLPAGIPSGTYTIKLDATNADSSALGCFTDDLKI